ncbi:hypothetical protein HY497_00715 [Candidatus Woesearchaeota archaeon]|nr:hypothetical protein [Candidatus Woesearchaeota archaeon]
MEASNKGYVTDVGKLVPLLERMIQVAIAGDTNAARTISNREFTPTYDTVFRGVPLKADDGTNSPEMLVTLAEFARNNAVQGSMDVGFMYHNEVEDAPKREDFLKLAMSYLHRIKTIMRSLGYVA